MTADTRRRSWVRQYNDADCHCDRLSDERVLKSEDRIRGMQFGLFLTLQSRALWPHMQWADPHEADVLCHVLRKNRHCMKPGQSAFTAKKLLKPLNKRLRTRGSNRDVLDEQFLPVYN